MLEEFVFEGELYIIPEYDLKMVEEYLEQYIYSMELFTSENDAVDWLEEREGESTLIIMPRLVTDILRGKAVFIQYSDCLFIGYTFCRERFLLFGRWSWHSGFPVVFSGIAI